MRTQVRRGMGVPARRFCWFYLPGTIHIMHIWTFLNIEMCSKIQLLTLLSSSFSLKHAIIYISKLIRDIFSDSTSEVSHGKTKERCKLIISPLLAFSFPIGVPAFWSIMMRAGPHTPKDRGGF